MNKTRILVVDDSSFIRNTLSKILSTDKTEVVGVAENGKKGVQANLELKPDIITLDIEMPIMNGLEALKEIMKTRPCPVIMLSSLTSDGANATIDALESGAMDFITKKDAFRGISSLKDEVLEKIDQIMTKPTAINHLHRRSTLMEQKSASKKDDISGSVTITTKSTPPKQKSSVFSVNSVSGKDRPSKKDISIICIGISTGGPAALMKVLPDLPKDFPVPILIAQHMPPHFTDSLARRLDSKSKISVSEAKDGDIIQPGHAYIAEGGKQMYLKNAAKLVISNKPEGELYKPSVNVLFDSVNKYHKHKALPIIMTGMGRDGGDAVMKMKKSGCYVVSQSIESSIAVGMPETIIKSKLVDEIYDLDVFSEAIISFFK